MNIEILDIFVHLGLPVADRINPQQKKIFQENLRKSQFWCTNEPSLIVSTSSTKTVDHFENISLAPEMYASLCDYFTKIFKLFADPMRCLHYLRFIEQKLATQVTFDSNNFQATAWIAANNVAFPLPPEHFKPSKKFNALKRTLVRLFTGSFHPDRIEINLLKSGDFWNTFGFIDKDTANQLVGSGEFFWELGYALTGNMHGSATHPFQIAIMILAHVAGDIEFPCAMSIKDILKTVVSKDMTYRKLPVWSSLLDLVNSGNFTSPTFIQSFLMHSQAHAVCPTLSCYLRESFWLHYLKISPITKFSVAEHIMLDHSANGFFCEIMPFTFNDLLARYQQKRTKVVFYPGKHTLFKKQPDTPDSANETVDLQPVNLS